MTWTNKEFEFFLHRHTLVVCRGHGFASFCCLHPRTAHEGHLWQMGLARDARRHIASKSQKTTPHRAGEAEFPSPPQCCFRQQATPSLVEVFQLKQQKNTETNNFLRLPPPRKMTFLLAPWPILLGGCPASGARPAGRPKVRHRPGGLGVAAPSAGGREAPPAVRRRGPGWGAGLRQAVAEAGWPMRPPWVS